jgi:hypothetical protein
MNVKSPVVIILFFMLVAIIGMSLWWIGAATLYETHPSPN